MHGPSGNPGEVGASAGPSSGTTRAAAASWPPGPARPPRPDGDVHVWIADLDDRAWPGAGRLPAAERERADGKRRAGPRRRWVASRWALRTVLSAYLGCDAEAISLRGGERAKPELAGDGAALRFNLSHSGPTALVAVATGFEVGVDVESIDRARDLTALAGRALPAEEAEKVRAADPDARPEAFYAAWVRREAVAKCHGSGLYGGTPDRPFATAGLEVGAGRAAALAVGLARVPRILGWSVAPGRSGWAQLGSNQ